VAGHGGGPEVAPWIIAGAGGATAIAGVVLLALTQADIETVRNGTAWDEIRDAHGRIEPLSAAGWTLAGVGLAAILAGVAWGLAAGGEDGGVAISPAGITVWGRF
jgi:hypothetical protein